MRPSETTDRRRLACGHRKLQTGEHCIGAKKSLFLLESKKSKAKKSGGFLVNSYKAYSPEFSAPAHCLRRPQKDPLKKPGCPKNQIFHHEVTLSFFPTALTPNTWRWGYSISNEIQNSQKKNKIQILCAGFLAHNIGLYQRSENFDF